MTTRLQDPPILTAALELEALGFWVVPVYPAGAVVNGKRKAGKEPIGTAWGVDRRDAQWLQAKFRQWAKAGAGICFGPGRAPGGAWLADLEGDGDHAAGSIETLLGGEELATVGWDSARGGHNIFAVDGDRLLTALAGAGAVEGTGLKAGVHKLAELPDLEFRIGGLKPDGTVKQCQSVVPPTPGTNGKPRSWRIPPSAGVAALPDRAYLFLEALAVKIDPVVDRAHAAQNGAAHAGSNGHAHHPFSMVSHGIEDRAIRYLERIDPAIEGSGGSTPTFRAACVMARFGLTIDVALRLMMDHYNPKCVPPWSEAELRHKLEDAYKSEPNHGSMAQPSAKPSRGPTRSKGMAASAAVAPTPVEERITVEINTRRDIVVAETIKAIVGDADLYCRGETLGVVIQETDDTAKLPGNIELRHARGNLRFLVLSPSVLGCRLTQNIEFYKWIKDRNGESLAVACHPPDWLISAVTEHRYWPGVRHLLSITECPYILTDGSLARPGFDPSTGTLYRPSIELVGLPDHPARAEAQQAAARLFKVFHQFPFEDGFSWSVWLAGLFTAIQRPAIRGPVPGFAFNGNKAGTGKGLLIDSIGILVWAHEIATRAYPFDPIEAEKVKLSLALAAVPVIHFDNLTEGGFYGGSVIDSGLTSTFAEGRILGQSRESGPVPLRPVWMLSGNNVSPMGDANRRWLPCNLVTKEESPHERVDIEQRDLRGFILEHRAELLADALLILRTHARAGRPSGPSKDDPTKAWAPLGSFEEWDTMVRGAVWFATGNDCLTTQRRGTEEMPDRALKLALLAGWKEIDLTSEGKTVEDALRLVNDQPGIFATLRSAFMGLSRDGKMPSVSKIAYKLRSMKRTPFNRMRFEKIGESRNHEILWTVIDV